MILKFPLARTNREIREHAAFVQDGNSWYMVGAYLLYFAISAVIGSLVGFSINYFTGNNSQTTMTIVTVVSMLLGFIIQTEIGLFGLSWSFLEMVDREDYAIRTIFKPFGRRPFRNLFVQIVYSLLMFIVNFVWQFIFGVVVVVGLMFMTQISLNMNSSSAEIALEARKAMAGFAANQAGLILLAVLGLIVLFGLLVVIRLYYKYALIYYLPYDSRELSTLDILGVSGMLMRGNKFKLFRLQFFYMVLPILFLIFGTGLLVFAYMWFNLAWMVIALAVILWVLYLVIAVIFTLRLQTAQAVFYRSLIDQYKVEIGEEYPEFASGASRPVAPEPDEYKHRPVLPHEDLRAVDWENEGDDTQAANQAVPGGAAAVFNQADTEEDLGETKTFNVDDLKRAAGRDLDEPMRANQDEDVGHFHGTGMYEDKTAKTDKEPTQPTLEDQDEHVGHFHGDAMYDDQEKTKTTETPKQPNLEDPKEEAGHFYGKAMYDENAKENPDEDPVFFDDDDD